MTAFDRCVATYGALPDVTRASMMGHPCLKVDGQIFASSDRDGEILTVKLPADRVAALIAEGVGTPFAPGGRAFGKWVTLTAPGTDRGIALVDEAYETARASAC